jgi:anionic cell wall polymer biosynthesis LytR-Cps2A-Psr (LCP) family protein
VSIGGNMKKSEIFNDGSFKRIHKKKKRKILRLFLIVLLLLTGILGGAGAKVYFDLKSTISRAYINPPMDMASVSLKKKESFTTAVLGTSVINGKEVLVSADMAATNPRLQQTTVLNISTSAVLPNHQSLVGLYNSGGAAAVIKEMEELLQVKTNKFVKINLDKIGEMVEAIGGVSLQNADAFNAQGYKFPQGTIALADSAEAKAYLTLLNEGDGNKLFERQQELIMAIVTKLKNPRVIIRHYSRILTAFPKIINMSLNFGNFKALIVNYHGATRISKINIHSEKEASQPKVRTISQANLDLAKIQFQESLK